jgi:hypothetical protein
MNNTTRSISLPLLAGDLLTLLLFVFIGQRDHGMSLTGALPSLLTTTLALALPWAIVAWLLGVLGLPGDRTAVDWLSRVAAAWLIAAPLGLILRALWRGQASIILIFMIVALGLGGLFVLVWRAAVYWWMRRRAARA